MKLNEICLNIVDCPHSTAPDEGSGYALVRTPNIGKGRFNLEGVHRISETAFKKRCARITPTTNDLILAREAPAGNVAIIKEGMEQLALGQRTVLIRPNPEKVYPDYLVYYLLAPKQQQELLGRANGATVAHVNIPVINNLPVNLPPLPTQQKIASILSAYDDLIENNRKQIKLLEEAAQKLYKEWFVKLNFPGHENTKIVDGVPEGWKKTTIGEIVNIKSGFAFKSDWWQTNGCPVVKIKDIGNNTIDITAFDFVSEERTSKCKDFLLTEGDLVIAMTGATIGKIGLVPKIENLYTNQRVGKFFPKNRNNWQTPFLFCFYNSDAVQEQIIAISSSSSAQPNISGNQLESFKLVLNEEMVKLFNRIAEPIFNKILKCQTEIQNCQSARDKLLPKLMNGEFDL